MCLLSVLNLRENWDLSKDPGSPSSFVKERSQSISESTSLQSSKSKCNLFFWYSFYASMALSCVWGSCRL